ncbi:MAG: NAD-dependent epimerase/dehydratase family protein [Phycisphaerales bacterium]
MRSPHHRRRRRGRARLDRRAARAGREEIVAIDIRELEPAMRDKCRETFVGDICDPLLLGRLLAMYEITEIYHLAALLSTRAEYAPESAHEVNVGGTLNLLRLASEQARSHGRKVKFIYPSSIAVYGMPDLDTKAKAGAVTEDEYLNPTTMYGCNKLYGEHLGRYYARHYRQLAQDRIPDVLDFRCVRYPGLISPHTVPSGGTSDFGPEMIHAAAAGKPYKCFVRESARIPFMTMGEAIEATLALGAADAKRLTRCVYNIGAFSPTAGEFADAVREAFPARTSLSSPTCSARPSWIRGRKRWTGPRRPATGTTSPARASSRPSKKTCSRRSGAIHRLIGPLSRCRTNRRPRERCSGRRG